MNHYNLYVAKKEIKRKKYAIVWCVNNIKIPHDDEKVAKGTSYIKEFIDIFLERITPNTVSPANNKLFTVNESKDNLCQDKSIIFHSIVQTKVWIEKRGRTHIIIPIPFL